MFNRLLFKVKYRYLIFICFLGLILNIKLLFISLFFISSKLYLSSKKITYLVLSYTFITFFIYELVNIKSFIDKNDYYTESNINTILIRNMDIILKQIQNLLRKFFIKKDY